MTRFTTILLSLILLLFNSWEYAEAQTLAFPGAEGFGRFTKGGRGGRVIEVTNLNEEGPGSLKAALLASGPRIIVFRVGGTITWTTPFEVKNPFVTIAGQTAPGDGIAIKGAGLHFDFLGANAIIRYIRVRHGPSVSNSGALALKGGPYMVDHVSTAWSTDDQLLNWFATDVTVQWSIIAEPINTQYAHGIRVDPGGRVSVHHNLYAMAGNRMPGFGDGNVDVVNNVTYWQVGPAFMAPDHACTFSNYVGNYTKFMPNPKNSGYAALWLYNVAFSSCSGVYLKGNLTGTFRENDSLPEANATTPINGGVPIVGTRFPFPQVTTTSATQAFVDVLAKAGATIPRRDAVDQRIVSYVQSGTAFQGTQGTLISDPSQVGGWPVLNSGTPPADTDHDGMPDSWEIAHGFNSNDPSDGPKDANGDGYTNVEEYLNSIVAGSTPPTETTPPAPPRNLQISWSVLGVLFAFLSPIGWNLLTRRRSKST